MSIRLLPEHIINQICAGEIAERPSSIIKELIENSIDAGAKNIKILVEDAGKSKIIIWDDGSGMNKQDLMMCVLRHATSKLETDDLFDIKSLGFRGEALASVASVADLKITTSKNSECWELKAENGKIAHCIPSTRTQGTSIEVVDLFRKIPARAKFLKSDKSEMLSINNIIEKIALSNPHISFNFNDKLKFSRGDFNNRIKEIIGEDFFENSIEISNAKNDFKLSGFVSYPQYNKGNSLSIFIFVNGRVIRDKNLTNLIKVAYQDVIAYDRYPVCVLNFECEPHAVDINVHPSKMEVRFLEDAKVKSFIIGTIRQALNDFCVKESVGNISFINEKNEDKKISESNIFNFQYDRTSTQNNVYSFVKNNVCDLEIENEFPLGFAVVQMFKTYILSKACNDFFITDQHAVHERIVLQKMEGKEFKKQPLLIPYNFFMTQNYVDVIRDLKDEIEKIGIIFEIKDSEIIITQLPDFLLKADMKNIITKIAEEFLEFEYSNHLEKTVHKIMATIACHGSIRAGQELSIAEMNAILRQLEITPKAGVCNHGRPTFFKVDKKELDKLFERI